MKILFQVIVACLQCIQHIRTFWLYEALIRSSWSITTHTGMDGFSSSPHWSHLSEVSLQTWWEKACAQGFLLLSSTLPQRTAAPPEKYTFLNTPCLRYGWVYNTQHTDVAMIYCLSNCFVKRWEGTPTY